MILLSGGPVSTTSSQMNEWLIGPGGVDPTKIVVAGDSAGGGLSAALLLRLRDAGRPERS
ncbi:alpha/beta hydrolase fold domain-containing protein [Kitasatospora atroaurantiaca]|uniref:alpha/beta hydrolase fold domain-containing protein n=1 Tax=Kitasatospora atroaurantiaca TaxID=285545 RepID=UPI0024831234|nr:alpha/beta hydrolase fold domain-containing protein [Kitasatospora atroaurantiaca]